MQISFNWIWQCFLLLCLPVEMSIWLHWTCDCISKACVDTLHWPVPKYVFLSILVFFWALVCWRFKTQQISESVNVSQNTLLSVSFFFSSFDLLIVEAWQRHLTSLFHVFVSRQRWILCLSFKVWALPFFTIHECTNLHLWGVWNPVHHVGLWQGTKKSWNIQVCGGGASVYLIACLAYLSRGEAWVFFRTAF